MTEDPRKVASEISQTLRNQQELTKQASAREATALKKVAALEDENEILRGVLDLVEKGVIDPADASSKVAEFLQDPEQYSVPKQAYLLGFDEVPSIGVPQDQAVPEERVDPISRVLAEMEDRLTPGRQV